MPYSDSFFPPDLDVKERLQYNPWSLLFLIFSIGWLFYVFFVIYYFFRKKSSLVISSRSTYLIFYSAIGQSLMMLLYTLKMVIGPENFPNLFDVLILWLAMPLHFIPYLLRCFRYIVLYQLAKNGQKPRTASTPQQTGQNNSKSIWQKILQFYKTHPRFKSDFIFCVILWILILISSMVGLIRILIPKYENLPGFYGYGTTYVYYSWALAMFTGASTMLCFGIYFVKDINNEYQITNEFISILIIWIVCIVPYSILGILDSRKYAIPITLIGIIECIASFLASFGLPVQIAYLKNDDPQKRKKDIFKSADRFLENEEVSALVYNWCSERSTSESFLFLYYVREYKKLRNHEDLELMYNFIVSKFLDDEAPFLINVPDDVRRNFFLNQPEIGIVHSSFDKMYYEIDTLLQTDVISQDSISRIGKLYKSELEAHSRYNEEIIV